MNKLRVALCQLNSTALVEHNLSVAGQQIADACAAGAKLVCLPEVFTCMSSDYAVKQVAANSATTVHKFLLATAKKHKIFLAAGSYPCRGRDKLINRSVLIDPTGTELARYDKIHLFVYHGKNRSYDETQEYSRGKKIVTATTKLGKIGLSICYDLRFPELYRRMQQPELILVPAAFTYPTGKAHWETLLRARAIENQAFVLAAAQCGKHPGGIHTFGHSLVINPWGEVVAKLKAKPGVLLAEIDLDEVISVRNQLPALANRVL